MKVFSSPLAITAVVASAAGVHADTPSPPVFPTSWSGHVHTIIKEVSGGGGRLDCDFAFDSITNQTSYRNCGEAEEQASFFFPRAFASRLVSPAAWA